MTKKRKHKGNLLITILFIIMIILMIDVGIGIPLGNKKVKGTEITLKIPLFSTYKEPTTERIEINSVRSTKSLTKDWSKTLNKLEKITCQEQTFYYDKSENYTIIENKVKASFPFNKIEIIYKQGKIICEEN